MCTIHGGRGPADRLRRGFDDSMVGGGMPIHFGGYTMVGYVTATSGTG